MSIHKSQGMSIDYLKVDLAESFEFGQGKNPLQIAVITFLLCLISVRRVIPCHQCRRLAGM